MSVLPQINPLPGAEREFTTHDGYAEMGLSEARLNVGRHVVWAFFVMGI